MLLVSGFAYRFFEFRGRDLLSKQTFHSRFCACTENDPCYRWDRLCVSFHDLTFPSFLPFFSLVCDYWISSLDLNFDSHCTRRKKTRLSRKGLQRMAFYLLDFVWIQRMRSHCYYFVTVFVLIIYSNCCCVIWPII